MQTQTPQGGDRSDAPVTIDSIFDDPTEGDAGEGTEQATESEAEGSIDSDEPVAQEEEAATDETAPEETGAPQKLTAESLANEYGLDLKNPAHRKIIDRMLEDAKVRAIAEKRVVDGQDYIKKLQEKISQGDYFANLERKLFQQEGKPPQQESAPQQRTPQGDRPQPQPMPQWNDGFDHWKSAADAQKDYADAWEKGDTQKAADVQMAMNNRWFRDAVEPYVQNLIRQAIESRVGPVLQKDRQWEQQQVEEDSRIEALEAIKQDSDMAKLIEEMFEPDGTTVTLKNGQKEPGNAIWKTLKDNDWIMDIKVDGKTPREAHRATWARRYLAMAQIYMRQKQQATISTQKGKEIFETGAKTAKDQAETARIRQTVTKGTSKGKSRPLSDDERFVAEISATSGTVGIPVSSLFK